MLAPIQHESMASYEKNTNDSSWKDIKKVFFLHWIKNVLNA